MKRVLKILKRTILVITGVVIVTITCVYFWISNRWSTYFSEIEIKELTEIVENSPSLSKDFYEIYDKIHPGHRQLSMNGELLQLLKYLILNKGSESCPCREVHFYLNKENNILKSKTEWKDEFKGYILGWGINKYSTPEKCFDYLISNQTAFLPDSTIFSLNEKYHFTISDTIELEDYAGPEKSSLVLFDKRLEELNEDEIIELIIRFEGPGVYDKKINQETFEKKFIEYKEKVNE